MCVCESDVAEEQRGRRGEGGEGSERVDGENGWQYGKRKRQQQAVKVCGLEAKKTKKKNQQRRAVLFGGLWEATRMRRTRTMREQGEKRERDFRHKEVGRLLTARNKQRTHRQRDLEKEPKAYRDKFFFWGSAADNQRFHPPSFEALGFQAFQTLNNRPFKVDRNPTPTSSSCPPTFFFS